MNYLATKSSRLSCRLRALWSFRPVVELEGPPFNRLSVAALPLPDPFDVDAEGVEMPFICDDDLVGNVNDPCCIASKSSGVGFARDRHMSSIERRLLISVWKTWWRDAERDRASVTARSIIPSGRLISLRSHCRSAMLAALRVQT